MIYDCFTFFNELGGTWRCAEQLLEVCREVANGRSSRGAGRVVRLGQRGSVEAKSCAK
jgi:hypothetical protein